MNEEFEEMSKALSAVMGSWDELGKSLKRWNAAFRVHASRRTDDMRATDDNTIAVGSIDDLTIALEIFQTMIEERLSMGTTSRFDLFLAVTYGALGQVPYHLSAKVTPVRITYVLGDDNIRNEFIDCGTFCRYVFNIVREECNLVLKEKSEDGTN